MAVNSSHLGCRVAVPGRGEGVLAFYGVVQFKDGFWAGVHLDQPLVRAARPAQPSHAPPSLCRHLCPTPLAEWSGCRCQAVLGCGQVQPD